MGDNAVRLTDDGPMAFSTLNHKATREDPYIRGITQDYADYLVSEWDFEHVETAEAKDDEPRSSVVEELMGGTLSDLEAALENGDYADYLDALEEYESNHKDRDGAYEIIDNQRGE